jgi:hypothetical protein
MGARAVIVFEGYRQGLEAGFLGIKVVLILESCGGVKRAPEDGEARTRSASEAVFVTF